METQIHPLILKRRSIFSFSDQQVEKEKLDQLFSAAGKAPSSYNAQPWAFIYAARDNSEQYDLMADLLVKANKRWALSAPILVLSMAEVISIPKNRRNTYAFHDLGIATGNFILQAVFFGLFVHPMGGFDKEKARVSLNIPDRYEPAVIMAVGYPGNISDIPDDLRERLESAWKRKQVSEFVRSGSW